MWPVLEGDVWYGECQPFEPVKTPVVSGNLDLVEELRQEWRAIKTIPLAERDVRTRWQIQVVKVFRRHQILTVADLSRMTEESRQRIYCVKCHEEFRQWLPERGIEPPVVHFMDGSVFSKSTTGSRGES